jgi:hypothetical protein
VPCGEEEDLMGEILLYLMIVTCVVQSVILSRMSKTLREAIEILTRGRKGNDG